MKPFMKNLTEYFAHAQTMCARPLLGGEGPLGGSQLQQKAHPKGLLHVYRSSTTPVTDSIALQ